MVTDIEQGPRAGVKWESEMREYVDPGTGATVKQLTNYPGGDDRHPYFTENGWYDEGRRLLVRSDREGSREMFSIDLETGQLTQLTDLPQPVTGRFVLSERPNEVYFDYSPAGNESEDPIVVALDLDDLSVRTVGEKPAGYDGYDFAVKDILADEQRLVATVSERVDADDATEIHDAYPHCALFTFPIEGDGEPELFHEEDYFITHVNASPTRSELVLYCHEGPWDVPDNRMHIANLDTGETHQLRPQEADERVGHEYWLADGEYVGYHGWLGERNNEDTFWGTIRYDNTDRRETSIPVRQSHCHSNTRDLFVCDGNEWRLSFLLLQEYDEAKEEYCQPRKLATHAWEPDGPHPHSRFSPDGSTVVFDADMGGDDANVFIVEVPDDIEELPVCRELEGED